MVFGFISNLIFGDQGNRNDQNARRRQKEEVVKVVPTVKPNRSGQMTVQKQLNFILAQEYIRNSSSQLCDSRSQSRSKTGSVSPDATGTEAVDPQSGRNSAGQVLQNSGKTYGGGNHPTMRPRKNDQKKDKRLSYAESHKEEFERPKSQISQSVANIFDQAQQISPTNVLGSISSVFMYPLIRGSREPTNTGSVPEVKPEVQTENEIGDDSVFVSIETDEGVHDSLDTTKSDTELKILESDDDEQRRGQEGHDRERSFEVKDDVQTRLKKEKREKKRKERESIVQKITLEHRNFDNPTVNTDFNFEKNDNSNLISKSLDTTTVLKDTETKSEFTDSYDRLAAMAGKSHAERRKKKLYASRGPRDIVELPRPDDELGIQLKSISRDSETKASGGTCDTAMVSPPQESVPPMGVPKLRNSQKLRNSYRLSESFLNPRCGGTTSLSGDSETPSQHSLSPTHMSQISISKTPTRTPSPRNALTLTHIPQGSTSKTPSPRHSKANSLEQSNVAILQSEGQHRDGPKISKPDPKLKKRNSKKQPKKEISERRESKELPVDVPTQELVSSPEPNSMESNGEPPTQNQPSRGITFTEIDSRIFQDGNTGSFKPLVRTESAPMKMDEFAIKRLKADRTMSRMMKLRIALGNAILPNVPQSQEELYREQRTKQYVEQQRHCTETRNSKEKRQRPVSMGPEALSTEAQGGGQDSVEDSSLMTRSTVNFSENGGQDDRVSLESKPDSGATLQNENHQMEQSQNISGSVPNALQLDSDVLQSLQVKADKAAAKKKRPWSGISLRKKKTQISESSPALNTMVESNKKNVTNKKPGLIEGMKMKKAANQRRLSYAIIQNTNKVKEKVKEGAKGEKSKKDKKDKDKNQPESPELITQKKFEKNYIRASREVLKHELATSKPPENATRAHKIKRAFSEMVIFAKPGEKNHHMHHPWARRALQDVILIESSSSVNSNSTSQLQQNKSNSNSPIGASQKSLRANENRISRNFSNDSNSDENSRISRTKSKDSGTSDSDGPRVSTAVKPTLNRSISSPVQPNSHRRITPASRISRPDFSRSVSLQTNQTPAASMPPQSPRLSELRQEADDRFDESPSLNGPRMSALDPELRKRISVTNRNSKSSSTGRSSTTIDQRTRRSSSVSKIENFQLSLGPQYKKRAPTFVRLAMRRTSSALGLDSMRRHKANNNFLIKQDSQEFHLGPFTMTKKIEN